MNETKYNILNFLESSNEVVTETSLENALKKSKNISVATTKKHLNDLVIFGCIKTDPVNNHGKIEITAEGRKYIDEYDYQNKLNKQVSKNYIITWLVAIISAIASVASIVCSFFA